MNDYYVSPTFWKSIHLLSCFFKKKRQTFVASQIWEFAAQIIVNWTRLSLGLDLILDRVFILKSYQMFADEFPVCWWWQQLCLVIQGWLLSFIAATHSDIFSSSDERQQFKSHIFEIIDGHCEMEGGYDYASL